MIDALNHPVGSIVTNLFALASHLQCFVVIIFCPEFCCGVADRSPKEVLQNPPTLPPPQTRR